jgi:hypothetical protein
MVLLTTGLTVTAGTFAVGTLVAVTTAVMDDQQGQSRPPTRIEVIGRASSQDAPSDDELHAVVNRAAGVRHKRQKKTKAAWYGPRQVSLATARQASTAERSSSTHRALHLPTLADAPARLAPVGHTTVKQTPVKHAPLKRSPAKRSPVKRTPTRHLPVEVRPIKLAPPELTPPQAPNPPEVLTPPIHTPPEAVDPPEVVDPPQLPTPPEVEAPPEEIVAPDHPKHHCHH